MEQRNVRKTYFTPDTKGPILLTPGALPTQIQNLWAKVLWVCPAIFVSFRYQGHWHYRAQPGTMWKTSEIRFHWEECNISRWRGVVGGGKIPL